MKNFPLFFFALFFMAFPLSPIDWPQDGVEPDSFYSYFGQLRGGTISASLIFALPSEIKAADGGNLLVVIGDYSDDTGFFPSALGTAAVISHDGNLLTVYGNIDGTTIPEEIWEADAVAAGTVFGTSGNSAWQQERSSLEFQVVDSAESTALNPRVLTPRAGAELPLTAGAITLEARNGTRYSLRAERNLPSGQYKIYRERQRVAVPYKSRVAVNGTTVDEISYDLLFQKDSDVYVAGKQRAYSLADLYPNDTLHLVGEAALTPGRNILSITLSNILGEEAQSSWSLTVN